MIAEKREIAFGALEAIQGAGKKIPVVGTDAIPDALNGVADGKMAATIFHDAHTRGFQALELAVDLVELKLLKGRNYIPFQL